MVMRLSSVRQGMAMRLYESISDEKEKLQVGLNWHDDPELLYFKADSFGSH